MKLNVPFGSSQPDPYIVGIGGKYYMYATHVDGVQLYVSSEKLNWDFAGFCFTREEYKEFWAPLWRRSAESIICTCPVCLRTRRTIIRRG